MNTLDLGAPYSDPTAVCQACKAADRPLWSTPGDEGIVACATCMVRRYPNRAITFHAGRGPITARQSTLPGLVA